MKPIQVFLELGWAREGLTALAALELNHGCRSLQSRCRTDHFPRSAATTGPKARMTFPGIAM
jgi:hypothetical protein